MWILKNMNSRKIGILIKNVQNVVKMKRLEHFSILNVNKVFLRLLARKLLPSLSKWRSHFSHTNRGAVFQAQNFSIVSFNFTQFVHKLNIMNTNIAGPIATRQVFAIRWNPDTSDSVLLVVNCTGIVFTLTTWTTFRCIRRIGFFDVIEVRVNVQGLEQVIAIRKDQS